MLDIHDYWKCQAFTSLHKMYQYKDIQNGTQLSETKMIFRDDAHGIHIFDCIFIHLN